jgi:hypothetical protein
MDLSRGLGDVYKRQELAPGVTQEFLQSKTGCHLIF